MAAEPGCGMQCFPVGFYFISFRFLSLSPDLVAQRGEKLELLIDKTENLVDSSVTFKTTSRNLARAMCMKNLKLTIVIIIVSIVIIYIILSAVCGGLAWPSCVQK